MEENQELSTTEEIVDTESSPSEEVTDEEIFNALDEDNEQEWQTKSHDRLLNYLSIKTLYNDCKSFEAHTICDNCNNYIRVEFNEEQIKIKYKNKEKDVNKKYIKIYKLLRMKEKFIAQTCLEKLNESEDL